MSEISETKPIKMAMATQSSPLHILFFPFLGHGHLLPLADVARLFALRGVKCTIVTTPGNVTYIEPTINKTNEFLKSKNELHHMPISISLIPFPYAEVGLPEGAENVSVSFVPEFRQKFMNAVFLLEKPFEQVLKQVNPDAFVSDTFFTWSGDVSARTSIPRLVFNGMGLLARSALEKLYEIAESLPVDKDMFVVPGLPHQFEMHQSQFTPILKIKEMLHFIKQNSRMDARSYGEITNSFLELEADYAVHWREVLGRQTWMIGPVALYKDELIEKSNRGGDNTSMGTEELSQWLDSKRPGSVLYICFGSRVNVKLTLDQIKKIAIALEESDRDFIWVVKSSDQERSDGWLDEFVARIHQKKRGLIIRGWAPQLLILSHPAVGCFITHCGWNSVIEAVSAGVPTITWPMDGDQYFNEKLITDILRVGVPIDIKEEGRSIEKQQLIEVETIKSVIESVMGEGADADGMRERAKELKESKGSSARGRIVLCGPWQFD